MTIVITGANRGIGRALFDHYTATDARVIGTSRGSAPTDGRWLTLDVTDLETQCDAAGALSGEAIDLLICNAGIYVDKGQKLDTGFPAAQWAETFAANVAGVFMTIQALLPNLRAAQGAKIAIISSQMGSSERAGGSSYIYRASKAASLNLGRNLAVDLKGEGIALGIYHPGWVRTDMGGSGAAISVEQAATGLAARFEALDIASTGCFLAWDGAPIPF